MAISDHPDRREMKSTRARAVSAEGKWWSDSQKLETVKCWLLTGNLAMTAGIVKVPEDTVRRWAKTTWWAQIVDDLHQEDQLLLSARLKKIVDKSFDVIEDRLEKGDFVYDQKTGQMRRKQVNMRDAHKVAIDLVDKREKLLAGHGPKASEEQVADKLIKLAEKFAELAGARKLETNTIEATDVQVKETSTDALSDDLPSHNWGSSAPEGVQEEEDSSTRFF